LLWVRTLTRGLVVGLGVLVWLAMGRAETSKTTGKNSPSKTPAHHVSKSSSGTTHASTQHSKSGLSTKRSASSRKRRRSVSWRKRGQQKIDSQRAHDIQEALIRERYLGGTPSGTWDDATQKAMQRYQADNGWQSTTTPDSRALIKLGLGPDHAHLLNPDSAMTSNLAPAHAQPPPARAATAASQDVPTSSDSTGTPADVADPAPTDNNQPK